MTIPKNSCQLWLEKRKENRSFFFGLTILGSNPSTLRPNSINSIKTRPTNSTKTQLINSTKNSPKFKNFILSRAPNKLSTLAIRVKLFPPITAHLSPLHKHLHSLPKNSHISISTHNTKLSTYFSALFCENEFNWSRKGQGIGREGEN